MFNSSTPLLILSEVISSMQFSGRQVEILSSKQKIQIGKKRNGIC